MLDYITAEPSTPVASSTEKIDNADTAATQNTLNEKVSTLAGNDNKGEPKVETPIIYLDLQASDSGKQSSNNKDFMSNSSLTRIKIKNPVMEIDKIISEAAPVTNLPSTESYTLPSDSKPANNIASGLIAGYPTYDQMQTVTENVPGTTLNEIVNGPNSKVSAIQQKNKNATEQSTTLSIDNSDPTSTFEYPSTETTDYESFTQIPFESLPIANRKSQVPSQTEENNDQINSSFIPPLEKISDLINQLQNVPSEPIVYDYSNGIGTTIVPMEKFESMLNEGSSTISDDTVSTIIDEIIRTSTEAQSNISYTLGSKATMKPYQSTTESSTQKSTILQESSTAKVTTQADLKTTAGSTTVLSTVKQTSTGKPHVTSTYSTTKASMEKIQSTIDKSAGRINLEEEKNKMPIKPTEPSKFTMKNKFHYSTIRRPEGFPSYTRKPTKPANRVTPTTAKTTTAAPTTTSARPERKEGTTEKWTLIPQKEVSEQPTEPKETSTSSVKENIPQQQIVPLEHATGAIGLDESSKGLDHDVAEFLNMCNEMSFKFWTLANSGLSSARSVTMSPFGMISTLAMIFLGARGPTSIQMNDILKLDDVVTFNPHLVFQNITDSVTLARGQGIENAAFVRALFADRLKVRKIIPFYKEQASQFYEGAVVDINFSTAGDILRRRTNLLIRKQTGGRIKDFMKTHTVPLRSPLTALSANVFQTSCDSPDASTEGRDGEMYFAVSQTVKQRKLVPIPAVVWKSGVSAGYEPSLDATAVALGDPKRPVSLIMVMPGQQGVTAPGDNLERLENRLFGNPKDNAFEKLLKVIIPRRVEVQMPKFSHRSVLNITSALKKMGFEQLFTKAADLKGINGAGHDLYLADMVQMNLFYTCGDENKLGSRHLSETYPGTSSRHNRAWEIINNINNGVYDRLENNQQENNNESRDRRCDEEDNSDWSGSSSESNEDVEIMNQQLPQSGKWDSDRINNVRQKMQNKRLRWSLPSWRRRCRNRRQAEPERPRMKMDKPFLYLIRHNLTGLILHIGRFNPKNQS